MSSNTAPSNSSSPWLPNPARWLLFGGLFLGGVGGLLLHVSLVRAAIVTLVGGLAAASAGFFPASSAAKWSARALGGVMIASACVGMLASGGG